MLLETVMPSFNDIKFCLFFFYYIYLFVCLYIYLTVMFETPAKWYGMMGWVVKNVLEKIMS
jgi:uncharacterized membrane protein